MDRAKSRMLHLLLFALTATCFLIGTRAPADDIVPWMSGWFNSYDYAFFATGFSNDQNWFFNLNANPSYSLPELDWQCDEFNNCYGQGTSYIGAGPVSGYIQHMNQDFAWYNGAVTYGSVYGQAWSYANGEYYNDLFQFSFGFTGKWSNGWYTIGQVYATWSNESEPSCEFDMTTYAPGVPEPGTVWLLGSALAGTFGVIRRKVKL